MFVRDEALTFDLRRVHGESQLARMVWALQTGLAAARTGPILRALVSTLKSAVPSTVVIGSDAAEVARLFPGQVSLVAAGQAFWRDGVSGGLNDMVGPARQRKDLAIAVAPVLSAQSAVEYTWHELLHLTVNYTHAARQGEASDDRYVDEARWDVTMNRIADELPATLRDPVTGTTTPVYKPFSSRECAFCSRLA